MTKRAVVLGGGGARGPYQIGVWRALRELGKEYSIVTGSSVGALNGALMVQGDYGLAVRMWENLTMRDVVADLKELHGEAIERRIQQMQLLRQVVEQGGLDVTPLESILRANIDEEKIRRSPIQFGIVSSRLPTFQPLQALKEDIPEGELVDYLLASASWFPFFKARRIGTGDYVDGAYTDNLPAELAVKCGATEIIAIDLQGTGIVHAFRQPIPVAHIRSHWNLGDMLEFDTNRARRNIRLGYLDGLKAYRRLEGNAYTFHPGETRKNAAALSPSIDRVRHRTGVSLFRDYHRLPRVQDMLRYRRIDNRFLPRKAGKSSFGCAVTTAAEITGELLRIPPDKTYTMLQFNRLLLDEAHRLSVSGAAGKSFLFRRPSLRANPALFRLYEMLQAGYYRGGVPGAFWRTAALAPAEFVAANYLVLLEAHYHKTGRP